MSKWKDWARPIVEEYQALSKMSFTNINVAGASTACTLLLEQLSRRAIAPRNIFMIDPLVEKKTLWQSLLIRMGSLFGMSYGPTQAFTPEEFQYWHGYRPFACLKSLDELARSVIRSLSSGIQIPASTTVTIWSSQSDPTVDPEGCKLIQSGIRGKVRFFPVDSNFHVFTRLSGRPQAKAEEFSKRLSRKEVVNYLKNAPLPYTDRDRAIQKSAFDAMLKSATLNVENPKPPAIH